MKFPPRIEESVSILDSEDLIDKAYLGLVSIMDMRPKSKLIQIEQHGKEKADMSPFLAVVDGVYIPGSARNYWLGRFDVDVDELPRSGCVYVEPSKGQIFSYVAVTRQLYPDKKVFDVSKNAIAYYKIAYVRFYPAATEKLHREHKNDIFPVVTVSYFQVEADGRINASLNPDFIKARLNWNIYDSYRLGAGALSLIADRKYLWNISTSEEMNDKLNTKAKIDFGIEEEMVKSLCYARAAPMTAADRRRPILHWVRQHKRRIEKGIDVDIRKHLRGITQFEMGDLLFSITDPVKKPLERKSA